MGRPPTQETPKGDILTKIIPYADTNPSPQRPPQGDTFPRVDSLHRRSSSIKNSPLTLKIIPKADGL